MKKFYIGCLLFAGLYANTSFAQAVGVGTQTPNSNAILDVSSTNKGLLPPRMTTAQRNAIPNTQGLLVYDVTDNSYYYNTGAAWMKLGGASIPSGQNPGDLLYWNGSQWVILPVGQDGQSLRICNGQLIWGTNCFPSIALTSSPLVLDFNGIGSPMPTGVSINIGATSSSLGTAAGFVNDLQYHWGTLASGPRSYASATGLDASTDSATQAAATNRAIGIRQTGGFGDPGAAFVFSIQNTVGKTNFQMSFKLQSLDITSTRTTTWAVEYGIGDTPASFTAANATGTLTTGNSTFSNNTITVNFANGIDNKNSRVWIRIVSLASSTGSGTRATTAVDDVSFTWQ